MCGIAGFLGAGDGPLLSAMAQRIAHRGPDGSGFFFDPPSRAGLAHVRLAVIDPTTAAAQPMACCDERYQTVFNGEIYNFKEIAAELRAAGYEFNPNSDTAVLAPLYDKHGIAGLSRLNGIFAFAIWDTKERELLLVRDGLGVKPLYIAETRSGLYFASELKALFTVTDLDRSVDEVALGDYLVHLWSPGEGTPLKSIRKLLPGHLMRIRSGHLETRCWYAPPIGGQTPLLTASEAKAEVRAAFEKAVARQCISDVPVGAFLSGGVDSSAVVAAMVDGGSAPRRTYCIGFEGASMVEEGFGDDLSYARTIAAKLGVGLTEIHVGRPEPEALEQLPVMLDEPEADPAALYVGEIARAARADGIKVLLGGTGGDDVFSGYRRHRAAVLRSRFGSMPKLLPQRLPEWLTRGSALGRRLEKLAYMHQGTDEEFLIRAFEFNRRDEALACLDGAVRTQAAEPHSGHLEDGLKRTGGHSLVDRMLHLEFLGFLPDHNLNYTDKASMAHGVEVRVPFLDTNLLDLAAHIPWQLKSHGRKEKWVFKEAYADRLPAAILNRKKTGFGAPVRGWFASGRIRDWAEDTISSRAFRQRGIFDAAAVRQLANDVSSGRRDGAYLLLAILMVEFWMRGFSVREEAGVRGQPSSVLA